jgi:predicted O-methyltransferase YrrM
MSDVGIQVVWLLKKLASVKDHPLRIVECGTIRNPSFEGHEDGLATYHIAKWLRKQDGIAHEFYSFELSVGTLQACQAFLDTHQLTRFVRFGLGDADLLLEHFNLPIDFAYLDAGANPLQNLSQYRRVEKWMRPPGLIVIDDVFDPRNANRGLVTVPYARLEKKKVANLNGRQALISFGMDDMTLPEGGFWL